LESRDRTPNQFWKPMSCLFMETHIKVLINFWKCAENSDIDIFIFLLLLIYFYYTWYIKKYT
jgi:hypothetical protein